METFRVTPITMSTVISFRLDENNPREARALQNLKSWEEKGFSVRHILTEALGRLEPDKPQDSDATYPQPGFNEVLVRLEQILDRLENGVPSNKPKEEINKAELNPSFVSAIRTSVKPGLKLE